MKESVTTETFYVALTALHVTCKQTYDRFQETVYVALTT